MNGTHLAVVQLSESFGEFWPELGKDVGVSCQLVDASAAIASPDIAAVLLAAGGCERDAMDWLDRHQSPPGTPVFAVGSDPGRRTATQLVRRGATDYFALPDDVEVLRNAVASAVEGHAQLLKQSATESSPPKDSAFENIIGESGPLKDVLARAACILPHKDATALIVGETGTGKELLAQALHAGSPRRNAPFVPVNCSAIPDNLIESELFGHERGAFTDAHAAKAGLFETADGGTLFLDELATLSLSAQAKLLRVLEDRVIRRVGGTKTRRVDVRIIAATNEAPQEAVDRGALRADLYFRLSVVTLTLPPLRLRGDDVVLIADALLRRLATQYHTQRPPMTASIREALKGYQWPGNIRELKNAVERALLLSAPGSLSLDELLPAPTTAATVTADATIPFPAELDVITAAVARATLDYCDGNRSAAARRLGISRQRLRRLLSAGHTQADPSTA